MNVEIEVSGFSVTGRGEISQRNVEDVAYELASKIGMELSSLGSYCDHGEVIVRVAGVEASSYNPDA